jgi:hypothetical protein
MGRHAAGFEFVQHMPNVGLSRENRSKIRRHAMRAVGAARRDEQGNAGVGCMKLQPPIANPAYYSELELLVMENGLYPADFSARTSQDMGKMYVQPCCSPWQ